MDVDAEHAAEWDRWAPVYDEWLGKGEDPAPAARILAEYAGGGAVLELGIGTGRMALELARLGVPVLGIDRSAQMIVELAKKVGDLPVRGEVGYMDRLAYKDEFRLVYVVISAFFGLLSQDAQVDSFAQVARALEPGGVFVLECFNPLATKIIGSRQTATNPRRDIGVRSMDDEHVGLSVQVADLTTQTVRCQELRIGAGGIQMLPFTARWAWLAELDLMGRMAGLRLVDRFEAWTRQPFDGAGTANYVSVYQRPFEH